MEAKVVGFFTQHDRFAETSTVAAALSRLDYRFDHIIDQNREMLAGKNVLDIASHDSRFSFAALKGANAAHVTGIEPRKHLVEEGKRTLLHYGIEEDRFDLIVGDAFDALASFEPGIFDTAMILGFAYHTARQYELFAAVKALKVKNLIVDSRVLKNRNPVMRLHMERTEQDSSIWERDRKQALSMVPSAEALRLFMENFGYRTKLLEPTPNAPKSAKQYSEGTRVTMVGVLDEAI